MESWRRFRQFVDDTIKELKRTSWPSQQEVYGTTVVVLALTAIIAAYLGAVDFVLAKLSVLLFAA